MRSKSLKDNVGTELRLRPLRGDLVVAVTIALIAFAILAGFSVRAAQVGGGTAIVRQNGETIRKIPLTASSDGDFTIGGDYHNIIRVKDGAISIVESDCPGGDCMRSGAISSSGRAIVCLPNMVEIRIEGGDFEIDAVAG